MGWPNLFRRKPRELSIQEQTKAQLKNDLILEDYRQDQTGQGQLSAEQIAFGSITFDQKALTDERLLKLVDPDDKLFYPLILPILPYLGAPVYLGNIDEKQARGFISGAHTNLTRLKNQTGDAIELLYEADDDTWQPIDDCPGNANEFILLDSMYDVFKVRIRDSVKGFKIKVLSEHKRVLAIQEEQPQKKRWGMFG